MSDDTPKRTVPQYIEPRKFCAQAVLLAGEIPGNGFQRLSAASAVVNCLNVELEFGFDQERHRTVAGTVSGQLSLECQRCLEPMPYSVDIQVSWAVVWDEEKAKQLPSRLEPWIAGEEAEDLYAMIEDELLLAIPTAPMHPELCIESSLLSSGDEELIENEKELTNNPFQALAALKGNSSKDQKN